MQLLRQSDKQPIIIEPVLEIGAGGEARIYSLRQELSFVAKVYHEPTEEKTRKLSIMLANPPHDPMAALGHASIAWPYDLLTGNSKIVGFLMPRVIGMRPIIDFYNPGTRRKNSPLFSYQYLYRTARNLSAAFKALHESGYIIGDVSESNILVSETSLITLVDTDSFQVRDPQSGVIYRCPVGRPEFTPPELQSEYFKDIDRTPEHDLFGLAVLIFLLLMEGTHPYAGIYRGSGDPPLYGDRISSGHFAYCVKQRVPYQPSKASPAFDIVDPLLRNLFLQCFEDGHKDPAKRPDAKVWQNALEEAERNLITCSVNDQHKYGVHLKFCPWCKRSEELNGRDPFPSSEAVKKGLHIQQSKPTTTTVRRMAQRPSIIVARRKTQSTAFTTNREHTNLNWQRNIRLWSVVAFIILLVILISPNLINPKAPLVKISEQQTLTGHEDIVTSVAFSPDSKIIASGSNDSTIRLWDTNTGGLIRTFAGQKNLITSVAFSPNGSVLAAGVAWLEGNETRGEIRLWDVKQGKLMRILVGHEGAVLSVAFSPFGKIIASSSADKTVKIWNIETGQLLNTFTGHQGNVTSVAFSNNGKFIASGSLDNAIRVWDIGTGKLLTTLSKRYFTPVTSLTFSPDDRMIVSGCYDKTARIWDLISGGLIKIIIGHKGVVTSVAFLQNGKMLITASADNTVRIWDVWRDTQQVVGSFGDGVTSVTYSPDGTMITAGSKDKTIKIWNVRNSASFFSAVRQILFGYNQYKSYR
jgi:WD40 repeat protein